MRALRALILVALCAWTLANWFHLEPVRRAVSPVMATSSPAYAPSFQNDALPLKALAPVSSCLGETAPAMSSLANLLRQRAGELTGKSLQWRIVLFDNSDGFRFRLAYRPQDKSAKFQLTARNEEFAFLPVALPEETAGLSPGETFNRLLHGKIILGDVRSTKFLYAGGKELTLDTDNHTVVAVDYSQPGFRLRCSAAYGPASCECSRP